MMGGSYSGVHYSLCQFGFYHYLAQWLTIGTKGGEKMRKAERIFTAICTTLGYIVLLGIILGLFTWF